VAPEGAHTPPCVCVVDDDAVMRHAMADLLDADGYRALLFESGEALLGWPRLDDIDAAVFDVGLGGMDGFALLARLRALAAGRAASTPVLLFSGQADAAMEARALRAGALGLLAKPVDPCLLSAHIEAALRPGMPRR